MSDGKESDKNHTIENVVTILAVSTMMFFLIILPWYGQIDAHASGNNKWYCKCSQAAATRCSQAAANKCQAAATECRKAAANKCKTAANKCSQATATECQAAANKCSQAAANKCQAAANKCQAADTECQAVATECAQENVKRSVTNICHPPESPWYSRTKHYKLQTMKACLKAEGRLPALLSSNCASDTPKSLEKLEKAVKEIERQGQAEEALGFLISPGIILGFGERPSDISIVDVIDDTGTTTTIIEHSRSRMQMRMALEVHWFWDYGGGFASDYLYGHGPFLAGAFLNGGSLVNPIEHLGIGYMIGLKFGENQKLNLGVGVFHNTKTEVLRDQYSNGQDVTKLGLERNDIVREDDDTALMLIISAIPLSIK